MRLNLTFKGLIYIAVPLIFQVIFLSWLVVLLDKLDHKAKDAERGRDIISKVGVLSSHFVDAGTAIASYAYTSKFSPADSANAIRDYKNALDAVPETYQHLRELTKDDPSQADHVHKLELIGADMVRYFEQYRMRLDNESGIGTLLKGYQLKKRMQNPFSQQLSEMTQQLREDEHKQVSLTNDTKKLVLVGVIVNLLLMIWAAISFSRNISLRIGVLSDNAMRVASRKELNKQMKGRDEIAELDRVLHQMTSALRAAEKEKQNFVSMISHDLRTPLSALQGTLALVAKGSYGHLSENGIARITKAETSLDRLIKLINELLDIEKLEAGMLQLECRHLPVQDVIDTSVESISAFAEQHDVKIVVEPSTSKVVCDKFRLVQVLVNLLSNAVKFSPQSATVIVSVEEQPNWLKINVKDEGRGIPPSALKNIFDRFKQVESGDAKKSSGTGLGLAISKSIVEAHKGEIGVISEVGKGSTFWFKLPFSATDG